MKASSSIISDEEFQVMVDVLLKFCWVMFLYIQELHPSAGSRGAADVTAESCELTIHTSSGAAVCRLIRGSVCVYLAECNFQS